MEVVKEEFDKTAICHGCLSVNRTVSGLGDYYKIFYQVLGDRNLDLTDRTNVVLCWECKAILKKFKTFQQKIQHARDMLAEAYLDWKSQDVICTLSTLGTVKKDNYDLAIDVDYQDASLYITEIEYPEVKEEELAVTPEVLTNSEEVKDESDQKCEQYSESDEVADTEYTPVVQRTKKKETHSTVRQQSIRVYEKYATVSKGEKINMEDLTKYYVKVHLSEKEMEDLMEKRDRRECSFRKMPYQCMVCNLGYKRLTDFNRHNQFNHCTYDKPVRCLECNKKQPSLVKMEKHWARHTRMFRCLQCYELCRSLGELKKHINRAHTSVYTCKACNVAYSTLREFSVHYRNDHQRMYCDHCGKAFFKKRLLEGHIRRNHMPAYCVVCNRSYQQYHVLENHLRTYHPHLMRGAANTEASYCVECDKQYSSVYKYKRHILQSARHTPQKRVRVPCPDCGKVFTRTTYMNNHYRLIHVKDTKHQCELCILRDRLRYEETQTICPREENDAQRQNMRPLRTRIQYKQNIEQPSSDTHRRKAFQMSALWRHVRTVHGSAHASQNTAQKHRTYYNGRIKSAVCTRLKNSLTLLNRTLDLTMMAE